MNSWFAISAFVSLCQLAKNQAIELQAYIISQILAVSDDERDSHYQIYDAFVKATKFRGIQKMTNFTSGEIEVLYSNFHPVVDLV